MKRLFQSRLFLMWAALLVLVGSWVSLAQDRRTPPALSQPPLLPSPEVHPVVGGPSQAPVEKLPSVETSITPALRPDLPRALSVDVAKPAAALPPSPAKERYQAAEQQVHQTAQVIRKSTTPPAGSAVPPQILDTERATLKTSVRTSFEARQELLRQEIAQFRARLDSLSQILESRERAKEQIIERRVDDLLNPELKWEDDQDTGDSVGATSTSQPRGKAGYTPARQPPAGQPPPGKPPANYAPSGTTPPADAAPRTLTIPARPPYALPPGADLPSEKPPPPKAGLEFLKSYPQLNELELNMTEPHFREIVARQNVEYQARVQDESRTDYWVSTGDGYQVIVMFRDGKVVGIQRIRGENRERPGAVDPTKPTEEVSSSGEKMSVKVFRLAHARAKDISKTLSELADGGAFFIRATANPATNSLIIFANPADMETITELLVDLDVAEDSNKPYQPESPDRADRNFPVDQPTTPSATPSNAEPKPSAPQARVTPQELRDQFADADADVSTAQAAVEKLLVELRRTKPDAGPQDVQQLKDGNWERLQAARKTQQMIRAEYMAQVKALEVELAKAEEDLKSAAAAQTTSAPGGGQPLNGPLNDLQQMAKLRVKGWLDQLDNYHRVLERPAKDLIRIEESNSDSAEIAHDLLTKLGIEGREVGSDAGQTAEYSGGVVVTKVREGSPAAKVGLQLNDVIVAADDWATRSSYQLHYVLTNDNRKFPDEPPADVRLRVVRQGNVVRVFVPPFPNMPVPEKLQPVPLDKPSAATP